MKLNKQKVILPVVSLLALTSFGLVGCGPRGNGGGSGADSSDVSISFWHTFNDTTELKLKDRIEVFTDAIMENEGVKVNVDVYSPGGYDEILKTITTGFSTGDYPTIAVAYPDHVANYLAKETYEGEYVVDLKPYIEDSEIGMDKEDYLCDVGYDDIVPSFREEGEKYSRDGIYSLPYMKSTEVMTYNKDIVQNALELKFPEQANTIVADTYMKNCTWEEFIELAKFINDHRADELIQFGTKGDKLHYVFGYESDANMFISQCFQRGIDYISLKENKDGTKTGSLDFVNDEAKAMVRQWHDLYQDQVLLTKGSNNDKYVSNKFTSTEIIFNIGSSGGADYNNPGRNFTPGNCPVPLPAGVKGTERAKYVSQGVTLALLKNKAASEEEQKLKMKYGWKLMKFLTNTEESINAVINSNGYIPARISSYNTEFYQSYMNENPNNDFLPRVAKIVVDDINGAYFNYPVFKGSSAARDAVGTLVTNSLKDKTLTDENLNKLFNTALAAASKQM